ncbi:hypothetical protein GTS_33300 [Gandjariella thermophila]|uniref:Uncharacterized protein n=1 Tax=Gandjariella thermophila TaxID=1931992 RepID=A0A4D4JCR8_9PSEU|nr:hypothetical protein GTS_33300 [Gandjariella thermophila]
MEAAPGLPEARHRCGGGTGPTRCLGVARHRTGAGDHASARGVPTVRVLGRHRGRAARWSAGTLCPRHLGRPAYCARFPPTYREFQGAQRGGAHRPAGCRSGER